MPREWEFFKRGISPVIDGVQPRTAKIYPAKFSRLPFQFSAATFQKHTRDIQRKPQSDHVIKTVWANSGVIETFAHSRQSLPFSSSPVARLD